jgi:hypothetical protein
MFKKIMVSLSIVCMLFVAGCGGIQMKDSDKLAAEAIFVESLSMMFDNNPELRAPSIKIAQEGIDLLNGKAVATRSGVVKWITDQVSAKVGQNKHMTRVMYILLNKYLPQWQDSTLNFISDADRALLIQLANDVLLVASE